MSETNLMKTALKLLFGGIFVWMVVMTIRTSLKVSLWSSLMPLSVDAKRIVKVWVIPREDQYGIAYEMDDGTSGNDLIGTKAEAETVLQSIAAQQSGRPADAADATPFPKDIAAT